MYTLNTFAGRWSAAAAYLYPALSRPNLSTLNNVLVTKVIFEEKTAVGVEIEHKGKTKVRWCVDTSEVKEPFIKTVLFLSVCRKNKKGT